MIDGAFIEVRCAGQSAFAPDAESAVVAARELYADAMSARCREYVTVTFHDMDERLLGALDGVRLHRLLVAEGRLG